MRETVNVVDFGTSKIVVLTGQRVANDRVDVIGLGVAPYAGYYDGDWNEPQRLKHALIEAIDQAQAESRRRIRDVYVGVPAEFCSVFLNQSTRVFNGRERHVSAADLQQLLTAAERFSCPAGYEPLHQRVVYYTLDGRTFLNDPTGHPASKLGAQMSFVLGQSAYLDAIEILMQQTGVSVRDFISLPLAEAVLLVNHEDADKSSVVVDVGYLSSSICQMENGGMVFLETIPIGGGHLTADLAMGLNISMEAAEQVKRRYVFGLNVEMGKMTEIPIEDEGRTKLYSIMQIQHLIEERLDELYGYVLDSIISMNLRNRSQTPVYLTGGGLALMRGVREYIANKLKMKVRFAAPRSARITSPVHSGIMGLLHFALFEGQSQNSRVIRLPFLPK